MSIFEGDPRERLEERQAEITPSVYSFLQIGERACAYASGQVQHNTLGSNVESILENGLVPGYATSVPDEDDLVFARTLMRQSSGYASSRERHFDNYMAGTKDQRAPGVFLSLIGAEQGRHSRGYGVPERSRILMLEMGRVMMAEGVFDVEVRDQAAEIYRKYRGRLYHPQDCIAVLAVDPFSPSVIERRLAGIDAAGVEEDLLMQVLPKIGDTTFGGLYIPEVIPPEDIRTTSITEPLPEPPQPINDIGGSRFYAPSPLLPPAQSPEA